MGHFLVQHLVTLANNGQQEMASFIFQNVFLIELDTKRSAKCRRQNLIK